MFEFLFWIIAIPGLYLGGACVTYKILRKTVFSAPTDKDVAGARHCATLWILYVAFFFLLGNVPWIFGKLFELIERRGE